jgi:hypothetical protein
LSPKDINLSVDVRFATLALLLAAAGGPGFAQENRTQRPETSRALWAMTEVRRQPLEPERLGIPRLRCRVRDGLVLSGARDDGSPLIVEAITF